MLSLASLPDEVWLMIVDQLNTPPPTSRYNKHIPTLDVFDEDVQRSPLKQLSLTCHRLRRLSWPFLARYGRINIFDLLQHASAAIHGHESGSPDMVIVAVLQSRLVDLLRAASAQDRRTLLIQCSHDDLLSISMLRRTMRLLWTYILDTFDPDVVTIHGVRRNVATILSCEFQHAVYRWEDDPYVGHRDLIHIQLYRKRSESHHNDRDCGMATKPTSIERLGHGSILHFSSWSHIHLNEGLLHYSTFDPPDRRRHRYFESTSLLNWLFPPCCQQHETTHSHRWAHLQDCMSFLDEFSYTVSGGNNGQGWELLKGVSPLAFVRRMNLHLTSNFRPDGANSTLSQFRLDNGADSTHISIRRAILRCYKDLYWRLKLVDSSSDDGFYHTHETFSTAIESCMGREAGWPSSMAGLASPPPWGRLIQIIEHPSRDPQLRQLVVE